MSDFSSTRVEIDPSQTELWGIEYLHRVQSLLPAQLTIDVSKNLRDRAMIYNWIGMEIAAVNTLLQSHLKACHECFNLIDRRSIQIFAVPFAASVPLDGFCNISTVPTTILVDVGRVARSDWLALVAHEYAHAHLGYPGHDRAFARTLSHLCLGLGLLQPPAIESNQSLYYWPPYQPTLDPLAFWRGE